MRERTCTISFIASQMPLKFWDAGALRPLGGMERVAARCREATGSRVAPSLGSVCSEPAGGLWKPESSSLSPGRPESSVKESVFLLFLLQGVMPFYHDLTLNVIRSISAFLYS